MRARSLPTLRPDPWGGIGHPTGNPAGLDGAGTGPVGRITARDNGTPGWSGQGDPPQPQALRAEACGAPIVLSHGSFLRRGPMRWHLRSSESYAKTVSVVPLATICNYRRHVVMWALGLVRWPLSGGGLPGAALRPWGRFYALPLRLTGSVIPSAPPSDSRNLQKFMRTGGSSNPTPFNHRESEKGCSRE